MTEEKEAMQARAGESLYFRNNVWWWKGTSLAIDKIGQQG